MRTVIIAFVLSCHVIQTELFELIDAEAVRGPGWVCESRGQRRAVYRRSSDRASVVVYGGLLPESANVEESWNRFTLSMEFRKHRLNVAPSGWKLGDACRHWTSQPAVIVKSRVGRCFVEVQISYRGQGPRGNVQWTSSDREGDKELVEGAVRHAVARIRAKDFASGPAATVNGRSVSDVLRDESARNYVPLDGWATARGVGLNQNHRLGTVAFAVVGRQVILALGTDQAKVTDSGARWARCSCARATGGTRRWLGSRR